MRHTPEIEHRLTVVEVRQESHERVLRDHRQQLNALRRKVLTPRDWIMIAGGTVAILAALAGKIDWQTALAVLAKN